MAYMKALFAERETETSYTWTELMEEKEKTTPRTLRIPLSIDDLLTKAMKATGADRTKVVVQCCSQENIRRAVFEILAEQESSRADWEKLPETRRDVIDVTPEAEEVKLKPNEKRG